MNYATAIDSKLDRTGRIGVRGQKMTVSTTNTDGRRQRKGFESMTRVTAQTQKVNTTPATRAKSERLDVVMLTSTYALIEGTTDLYQVWLDTLECSCKAAQYDLRCSHVMRVIRALAARAEMPAVMFAHSPKHAASWARLQESKGRTARVEEVAGYAVCVSGRPAARILHGSVESNASELFS